MLQLMIDLYGVLHDVVMVEGKLGQLRQGPPLCLSGIIMSLYGQGSIYDGQEGYGHRSATWVAVDFGIGSYLLNLRQLETRLFFHLTHHTLLYGLIHLHEAAREGPAALVGLYASLDKQHTGLRLTGYHYAVSRQCRPRIFVCI